MSGIRLRPAVLAARERLAHGREQCGQQHAAGAAGRAVCAAMTEVLDAVVLQLYQAAWNESREQSGEGRQGEHALVAHGGYGRSDVAPYSDVDLMLLHAPGAAKRVGPLAKRLTQDLCDAGLQLGFSLRTPHQARGLALQDATIFTSLVESRLVAGSGELFARFEEKFRRATVGRRGLVGAVEQARREERARYGGTVYLLEPNLKRSRGGLRDIQLVRWIGFARYGLRQPAELVQAGRLSAEDAEVLEQAGEFLLRLRNELHLQTGRAQDVVDRGEQVRLAQQFGYPGQQGLLPVEQFMRDYFEHTSQVYYTESHFVASARPRRARVLGLLDSLVAHPVEGDFRVGRGHIRATARGLEKVRSDLDQVLRLMDLANLYDRRIDHTTWQAIRQAMASQAAVEVSPQAVQRFLSLLSQPGQLGDLLRRLHQLRVLEKLVPAMAHARCLLQFNEYHKYTVDEHSIRAVECATEFQHDPGLLGEIYRGLKHKRILHLALLVHDLGKGFAEDHSEVGLRLAADTARRLGLPDQEAETLKLLVHKHLLMAHLALRRDIEDEDVVVQLAIEVGSPDVLQMLLLLTCADLAAVGPGVLNPWKQMLLVELYHRTMQQVAGELPDAGRRQWLEQQRRQVRDLADAPQQATWWDRQLAALPAGYLLNTPPPQIVEELGRLQPLGPQDAVAWGCYLPQRNAVQYTVGTYEQITAGVFHKLTGALSSQGLQILAAEIYTLADSLVLDRFYVHDSDFSGPPTDERLEQVSQGLVAALKDTSGQPPTFRRLWQSGSGPAGSLQHLPTRVHVDNSTAERFTILDIFAHDQQGLLYTIARTLFQLGLSVHRAKIGTYLDQVVDVFYVTDQHGHKIEQPRHVEQIRQRLLDAIDA